MNRLVSLVVLTLVAAVPAFGLTVVNTSAPQVNCIFSTSCTVYVTDMGYDLPNGGRIQSRVFQGQPGSQAAGKWVYQYRLIMTNAVGYTYIPYVDGMSIANWGPVVSYDYNFDGNATDQVFNIVQGGIGTVSLATAPQWWGITFFNLADAVYGGSYPGGGESSRFFGLVSPYPPVVRGAYVDTDQGSVAVNVYAPQLP